MHSFRRYPSLWDGAALAALPLPAGFSSVLVKPEPWSGADGRRMVALSYRLPSTPLGAPLVLVLHDPREASPMVHARSSVSDTPRPLLALLRAGFHIIAVECAPPTRAPRVDRPCEWCTRGHAPPPDRARVECVHPTSYTVYTWPRAASYRARVESVRVVRGVSDACVMRARCVCGACAVHARRMRNMCEVYSSPPACDNACMLTWHVWHAIMVWQVQRGSTEELLALAAPTDLMSSATAMMSLGGAGAILHPTCYILHLTCMHMLQLPPP